MVSHCQVFESVGKWLSKVPLHLWKWPVKPWVTIHIYFLENNVSLLLVDAYSKWFEVITMTSVASLETIKLFHTIKFDLA